MDGLDNGRPVQSKWDRLIARCHPQNVPNMVIFLLLVSDWLKIFLQELARSLAQLKGLAPINEVCPGPNEKCFTA